MALYRLQAVHSGLLTKQYFCFRIIFFFCQEIATYDDVWIVPIEAGLEYMRTVFFESNLSNEKLIRITYLLKTGKGNMKRPETIAALPRVAGYMKIVFFVRINFDSQGSKM